MWRDTDGMKTQSIPVFLIIVEDSHQPSEIHLDWDYSMKSKKNDQNNGFKKQHFHQLFPQKFLRVTIRRCNYSTPAHQPALTWLRIPGQTRLQGGPRTCLGHMWLPTSCGRSAHPQTWGSTEGLSVFWESYCKCPGLWVLLFLKYFQLWLNVQNKGKSCCAVYLESGAVISPGARVLARTARAGC